MQKTYLRFFPMQKYTTISETALPYPYTEQDGLDFISAMLSADANETFAFAITTEGKVIGSIGVFRQGTFTDGRRN